MISISKSEQQSLTQIAIELADAARAVTLAYFRQPDLMTENKEQHGFDPVTVADRAAEQAMRTILAKRRPQDGILGEEFGSQAGTSGLTWVLDPIDGTRGYMSGTPTWGVLIALSDDSGPRLGIVDQPYIGERFLGGFGAAWTDGPLGKSNIKTRAARPLQQSILFTTFPEVGSVTEQAAFQAVSKTVQLTRFGMDCYAYALLAAGHIDLVIEAGLNSYDIHAPIAVIQAAGGIVTDWAGRPAHAGGRVLAAANAVQHQAALEILSEFPAL